MNFSAMILAAGFGKRMLPLTKDIPKPLIEINGITLLDNSINFLNRLGCNQIIINSHYKYPQIKYSINQRKDKNNIVLVYESEILDTGGGVKNAIPYFKNNNLIIINSDIFWHEVNIVDVKNLINKYKNNINPHLLLVEKKNAYGLNKIYGDFILSKSKILRFKKGNELLFYSGLQVLNLNIFDNFSNYKFSFNEVWNFLIRNKRLYGDIMQSEWYHIGDIEGLKIAKKQYS